MTYYIYFLAQIGLTILFVWSVIKIGSLIKKKETAGWVKYGIFLLVSTLGLAGLVLYPWGNLLSMGVIIAVLSLQSPPLARLLPLSQEPVPPVSRIYIF